MWEASTPLPSTWGHFLSPAYDTEFKVSILQLSFWVPCWPFLYFLLSDTEDGGLLPPQSFVPFQSFLVVFWRRLSLLIHPHCGGGGGTGAKVLPIPPPQLLFLFPPLPAQPTCC